MVTTAGFQWFFKGRYDALIFGLIPSVNLHASTGGSSPRYRCVAGWLMSEHALSSSVGLPDAMFGTGLFLHYNDLCI